VGGGCKEGLRRSLLKRKGLSELECTEW
jgi:hypothetical protein